MKIIVLDTTTKTICAALSSAVATSNPDFVVAYADTSDNTFSELSSDGQLNGTTDVTLVSAPASGVKRTIKSISVYNRDTAPVIVVIKLDVSGTQRILQRVQLVSGETWHSDELTKLSPGGSDTQVQFNDLGTLAGSSNFTYNKTTSVLTLGANPVLSAGTANGVLYLNGSKSATTGSVLTFDGAQLGVNGITLGRGAGAVSTNTAVGASALAANTTGSVSTAVGYQALSANTGIGYNTAVGFQALATNTSGYSNSAFGLQAMQNNTSGVENFAAGNLALRNNTTGASNTASGMYALYSNTTASNNTAVGYQSGYSNTTGTLNTSVGGLALYSNTTSNANTAVGYNALYNNTGEYNTAMGYNAGYGNTSGSYNIAIGSGSSSVYAALRFNTTGSQNVAVGNGALGQNTTASNNTAVGYQAGYSNTTGTNNTAVGRQALYFSTATGNTALGDQAGDALTSGGFNTMLGYLAGSNATIGTYNTFIGTGSGLAMTTGAKNSILGCYDGNQGGLDIRTASNYIVLSDGDGNPRGIFDNNGYFQVSATGLNLGGGTTPSIWRNYGTVGAGIHLSDNSILPTSKTGSISDNTVTWGNGSYRWSTIYAANGTINTSDQNEKQDIQDLSVAELDVAREIKSLFKTFRWKDAVAKKGDSARIHVGVIAQDVQAAFAKHGLDASRYALWCSDTWYEVDGSAVDNKTGMPYTADAVGAVQRTRLGVRYDQLLAFVIAAI